MDAETGDNQEHDFQIQLSVLQRNKKGNPIVILGTKKDITDELRMEQDAEERLIRYKTIFDSSTIGIIVFNAEGQLTNINEKACSLFQCDKKDIIRQSPSFRTLFELEEDHIEALDGVSMCRKVDFDNHLTSKELGHIINQSGTQIFEIHMMVACDEANEHANNLLVVVEDIRQHIEIKKQWKDKLARKRDLQHQLDNYIDHTNYLLKVSGMRSALFSRNPYAVCQRQSQPCAVRTDPDPLHDIGSRAFAETRHAPVEQDGQPFAGTFLHGGDDRHPFGREPVVAQILHDTCS